MYDYTCTQPVKKSKKAGAKKATGKKKGKTKGKVRKGKSKEAGVKAPKPVADPLSHAAMLNAYYISHGPVQFLEYRGYKWEGSSGKTKKKKGKKK